MTVRPRGGADVEALDLDGAPLAAQEAFPQPLPQRQRFLDLTAAVDALVT